ncbi:GNAT family N-acetyltransferase [Gramella sp. MT6]|uniref:GNAT family N-acetyltransferase n=1 Tax=Gramella sp. MT6 TaxID=2705471 RepID=UPI001C5E3BDF|nr:GNAT family N-acetyltransferase [Gramella sp. MT6]QYA26044.1 GNAT family N-acetyltransferase [Gramella sp. MT6]
MTIREANKNDISGILNVLKASLGEQSSNKTIEVWSYKHLENPFGKSLVLIAEFEGKIVGVRAFMRWEWKKNNETFKAYRAVDTATHPEFQGKGVFKRLTLTALKYAENEGGDFIFNTPNSQSKPGYLRMGWVEVGRLKVSLLPVFSSIFKSNSHKYTQKISWTEAGSAKLFHKYNSDLGISNKLFTPKSKTYLEWRYLKCPLQKYRIDACDEYFIAGYVKHHSNFKELRISELIIGKVNKKLIKSIILNWAREHNVHFISFSYPTDIKLLTKLTGNYGPSFTLRCIQESKKITFDFIQLKNLDNWRYSLGDLELF